MRQVTLTPSAALSFQPHPQHDGGTYSSLQDMQQRLQGEGYSGGIRLLKVGEEVLFHPPQSHHIFA